MRKRRQKTKHVEIRVSLRWSLKKNKLFLMTQMIINGQYIKLIPRILAIYIYAPNNVFQNTTLPVVWPGELVFDCGADLNVSPPKNKRAK